MKKTALAAALFCMLSLPAAAQTVAGWPDYLLLNVGNGPQVFYAVALPGGGSFGGYAYQTPTGGGIIFNPNGTFNRMYNSGPPTPAVTTIAALVTAGDAFNFAGKGGTTTTTPTTPAPAATPVPTPITASETLTAAQMPGAYVVNSTTPVTVTLPAPGTVTPPASTYFENDGPATLTIAVPSGESWASLPPNNVSVYLSIVGNGSGKVWTEGKAWHFGNGP